MAPYDTAPPFNMSSLIPSPFLRTPCASVTQHNVLVPVHALPFCAVVLGAGVSYFWNILPQLVYLLKSHLFFNTVFKYHLRCA